MNPDTYIHSVDVKRATTPTPSGGGLTTVFFAVSCLIEPIATRTRDSFIGRIAAARFHMTWGSEAIIPGDTIVFNGASYVIQEVIADTLRPDTPYQVGILTGRMS